MSTKYKHAESHFINADHYGNMKKEEAAKRIVEDQLTKDPKEAEAIYNGCVKALADKKEEAAKAPAADAKK
jgi:hypothetical protein